MSKRDSLSNSLTRSVSFKKNAQSAAAKDEGAESILGYAQGWFMINRPGWVPWMHVHPVTFESTEVHLTN